MRFLLPACLAALVLLAPSARAADRTSDATSVTLPHGDGNDERNTAVTRDRRDASSKRFAFEISPLGILVGHYSVELELVFAPHSVLTISPFFDHSTAAQFGIASDESGVTGFGTEVGYTPSATAIASCKR